MIEMIDNENKNGLKGQHNLAQGFDVSSVERQTTKEYRLGLQNEKRNRPCIDIFQMAIIVLDEKAWTPIPSEEVFCPEYRNSADGFRCVNVSQGDVSVRSS